MSAELPSQEALTRDVSITNAKLLELAQRALSQTARFDESAIPEEPLEDATIARITEPFYIHYIHR